MVIRLQPQDKKPPNIAPKQVLDALAMLKKLDDKRKQGP
jgi:hypothetical protein